jgi:hypothetical protein
MRLLLLALLLAGQIGQVQGEAHPDERKNAASNHTQGIDPQPIVVQLVSPEKTSKRPLTSKIRKIGKNSAKK